MTPQSLLPIILIVVVFYLFVLRPQRKRAADAQRMMNALEPGTRVLLGSGIFGEIVEIGDRQARVEIAPGVEMTVLKQAIARAATEADQEVADPAELDPEPGREVDAVEADPLDAPDRPFTEPAGAVDRPFTEPAGVVDRPVTEPAEVVDRAVADPAEPVERPVELGATDEPRTDPPVRPGHDGQR